MGCKFRCEKYRPRARKVIYTWRFVPCDCPSDARIKMGKAVLRGNGTQYRLAVRGSCFGFEYK